MGKFISRGFKSALAVAASSLALTTFSSPALAQQDEASANAGDESDDEIVVTGTMIRGIAPAGAQTLGVGQADIEASGATLTDELLATIPQVSNLFGGLNAVGQSTNTQAGGELTTNRYFPTNTPTVRGLSTLLLVDGRRMASAGGSEAIPPAAMERVEVVPDGGSSIYGADAVGGVINFITRSRYDGVGADVKYGFGDEYESYNANLIAGHDWGSGSAFAAFNYDTRSDVFGADRDYIQSRLWSAGPNVPFSLNCAQGNVTVAGVTRAVSASGSTVTLGNAGTVNRCDQTDYQTMSPEETRENIMVSLTQELTDAIEFRVRAYHADRETHGNAGPNGGTSGSTNSPYATVSIGPTNPHYIPIAGSPGVTQQVRFNYATVNGFGGMTRDTTFEQWGVSPTLSVDIGEWQLNLLANYDRNETVFRDAGTRSSAQTAAAAGTSFATALNPYAPYRTDPAVLANILNWQEYGNARRELTNYRAVFDGPLIQLPGGEVRAAIGAEFIHEDFEARNGESVRGGEGALPWRRYDRDVDAFFGELQIPVVGPQNNIPAIESLSLSLSARRDNYEDFGETTNPRIGLTYEPVDWIAFRANWGESFVAPSTSDQAGSGPATLNINALPYTKAGDPPLPGQTSIILTGAREDLRPQEATTWSYGFDVEAPFLPGLRGSLTYYNVEFRGLLGNAPIFSPSTFYRDFVGYYILHPTATEIQAYANMTSNPAGAAIYIADPTLVYQLMDYRRQNLGSQRQEGLDFSVNYTHDASFGTLDFGVAGNYPLEEARAVSASAAFVETNLDDSTRERYTAHIGAEIGDLTARLTYNYRSGYNILQGPTVIQNEIRAWEVFDFYARYDLGELGMADDLAVTLNIDNVLDKAPPILRADGNSGIDNGGTLGRVFSVGLSARF